MLKITKSFLLVQIHRISIEITIPKQVDGEDIVTISETGSVVLPGRFFVDIIKTTR